MHKRCDLLCVFGVFFLMNYYELSRAFFDWAFENPSKVSPNHVALYFFAVEHCNRLGWKREFGLPTTMAKEAIGIRSYNTYIKTLTELVEFGFIIMIEKSKNQYSSNIIALSKFDKALDKALDKAMIKHVTKQCESTEQSNDSIDKQIYNIQINNKQEYGNGDKSPTHTKQIKTIDERKTELVQKLKNYLDVYGKDMLNDFFNYWTEKNEGGKKMRFEMERTFEISKRLATWHNREKTFKTSTQKNEPYDFKKQFLANNTPDGIANR